MASLSGYKGNQNKSYFQYLHDIYVVVTEKISPSRTKSVTSHLRWRHQHAVRYHRSFTAHEPPDTCCSFFPPFTSRFPPSTFHLKQAAELL